MKVSDERFFNVVVLDSVDLRAGPSYSPTPAAHRHRRLTGLFLDSGFLLVSATDVDHGVDRLHTVGAALQRLVDHAGHIAIPVAIILASAYVALRVLAPRVSAILWPSNRVVVRIVPPAESTFIAEAWTGFYRSLLAITPPAWKRLLVGVPWVTLEYRWSDGHLCVLCSCPADAAHLVTAAAQAALPGADVVAGDLQDPVLPELPAARARLGLWREPLFPLGVPQLDPLQSVIAAMTSASEVVLQIAVEPHPGWERRAQRRLDRLSGYVTRSFLLDGVASTVAELVSIILPFAAPHSMTHQDVHAQPPSRRGSLPPAEKAWTAVFRAEVRLCASAPSRQAAKQTIHAMMGGFRGLDGANGLRPKRVLGTRRFDHALLRRAAPGRAAMCLSPSELALLFHLPVSGADMESARVRLAGPRLPERAGSTLCQADGARARLVRIAQPDRRQHLSINGPTGSGKSALLMSLALQDVRTRIGVGAIDPKGST